MPPRVEAPAQPGRIATLDALRCLAVLLVLGRHIHQPELVGPPPVAAMLTHWMRCGWIGVDLFFVLSGFLVAGLLFCEQRQHGRVRIARFLWRRGWKIYPGYYLLLVLTWIGREQTPWLAYVAEALFLQNYLQPGVWPHTWSLAVEEHFYLALATLFGLTLAIRAAGRAMPRLPVVIGLLCVVTLGMRIATWHAGAHEHLLFATHLRLDSLAFGVLLSYWWHHHRERTLAVLQHHRGLLATMGLLLVAPCLLIPIEGNAWINTVGLTGNYLGFGALLMLAVSAAPSRSRTVLTLAQLGTCSYSIYLWHLPVHEFVRWHIAPILGHGKGTVCYLLGSLLVGMVMARLVELPLLKLRDRLTPRRRPTVAKGGAITNPPIAGSPPARAD